MRTIQWKNDREYGKMGVIRIRGLIIISGLMLMICGCGTGGTVNTPDTGVSEAEKAAGAYETEAQSPVKADKEDGKAKQEYPRDLAAFLLPDMIWEIGTPHPSPQDFFDSEKLLETGRISEKAFEAISFVSFPADEELDMFGTHEVIIGAGDMKLYADVKTVDTTPPEITVPEKSVYQRGEAILYKKDVVTSDNSGETPFMEIDNSEVVVNLEGEYKVYYHVKDSSGNSADAVSVIVIRDEHEVDEEELEKMADELLGEITTADMTGFDKAKAVFDWCNTQISMTADAGKFDYLYGAYDGLYFREGDCYTVYATAAYLLDRCGIDNISVSHRINDDAVHYWSLVNVGDGWYHFDASRHDVRWKCFMQTVDQVRDYGEEYLEKPDYYTFEQQDTPELATKIVFGS